MFGFTRLMNAFASLAAAVQGLADTVRQANTDLRTRLGYDESDVPAQTLLVAAGATQNGQTAHESPAAEIATPDAATATPRARGKKGGAT